MAKKTALKIPKRVLGLKLSKTTRKDLRKLVERLRSSEARAVALTLLTALAGYVGEQAAEGKGPMGKGKVGQAAGKALNKAAALAGHH